MRAKSANTATRRQIQFSCLESDAVTRLKQENEVCAIYYVNLPSLQTCCQGKKWTGSDAMRKANGNEGCKRGRWYVEAPTAAPRLYIPTPPGPQPPSRAAAPR